jgi:hypothetical protein
MHAIIYEGVSSQENPQSEYGFGSARSDVCYARGNLPHGTTYPSPHQCPSCTQCQSLGEWLQLQ